MDLPLRTIELVNTDKYFNKPFKNTELFVTQINIKIFVLVNVAQLGIIITSFQFVPVDIEI